MIETVNLTYLLAGDTMLFCIVWFLLSHLQIKAERRARKNLRRKYFWKGFRAALLAADEE
ncbi:hypothetical protein COV93_03090 [Candidatus Woesearchaeota archaeon CG11_big_fil_rev_8_21_14_0_20_43_8]|nr:MAG: hypothetical protein COV93_03090 [Candidatus Woesearchaeota archaeon CG11_big_fil_rev_8_21_14_0_20_43_8]PIO05137.1 MAG: hypothetical protein COT47_06015 [Candidatus Woesearchaeota archaeon CG08_land_8_20_14_0_20_43_7]